MYKSSFCLNLPNAPTIFSITVFFNKNDRDIFGISIKCSVKSKKSCALEPPFLNFGPVSVNQFLWPSVTDLDKEQRYMIDRDSNNHI